MFKSELKKVLDKKAWWRAKEDCCR